MKYIFLFISTFIAFDVSAAVYNCGTVSISQVLTGPRHGAMMRVSNPSCGNSGWVCLDPDAQHMTVAESKRLFEFVVAQDNANNMVKVSISNNVYSTACNGNFPVIEDIRTP